MDKYVEDKIIEGVVNADLHLHVWDLVFIAPDDQSEFDAKMLALDVWSTLVKVGKGHSAGGLDYGEND